MKLRFLNPERPRRAERGKGRLRRVAAAALTAVLAAGAIWPALTADASVISIDGSGFDDPTRREMWVYYWYPGLPVNNRDNEMKKFPVLMTWGNAYYFLADTTFASQCAANIDYNRRGTTIGWSNDKDDSGTINGSFRADGRYPHGLFCQNMGYNAGYLALLEELDFTHLRDYGRTVSFSLPEHLPEVMPLNYDEKYAILINYEDGELPGREQGGHYYDCGGFRAGENFLAAARYNYYRVGENIFGWDIAFYNQYHWSLYGIHDNIQSRFRTWFNKVDGFDVSGFVNRGGDHENETIADNVGWKVTKSGDRYYFWSSGFNMHDQHSRVSHSASDDDELEWLLARKPMIALSNYNTFGFSALLSWGNAESLTKGDGFKCYYGVPVIMNFVQTSFTVENGQVVSLDGPAALTRGTTATVKEGGTLSIKNWVLNQGQIIVEEGGTLYIQDGACLNRYNDGKHDGGSIISNGLIIVGEGAKVIGGGADGIQLLDGSHVVNFGCLASENFKIQHAYTVENRDGGFTLYGAGNGVGGFGCNTFLDDAGNGTFTERAKVEDNPVSSVVENAIYDN